MKHEQHTWEGQQETWLKDNKDTVKQAKRLWDEEQQNALVSRIVAAMRAPTEAEMEDEGLVSRSCPDRILATVYAEVRKVLGSIEAVLQEETDLSKRDIARILKRILQGK